MAARRFKALEILIYRDLILSNLRNMPDQSVLTTGGQVPPLTKTHIMGPKHVMAALQEEAARFVDK